MKYDKAAWHSDGDFPRDVPPENGGTHIGIFLALAILHDMKSDELRCDAEDDLLAVRERRMTGRTFLFRHLDGALIDDDLNESGNAFAKHYYNNYTGEFDREVRKRFASAYHIDDSSRRHQSPNRVSHPLFVLPLMESFIFAVRRYGPAWIRTGKLDG